MPLRVLCSVVFSQEDSLGFVLDDQTSAYFKIFQGKDNLFS